MRFSTRLALVTALVLALPACSIVYKLPTRQGNVIEQSELNKLELGMTQKQVAYLLGTPVASSPFDANRWDYFGYYKSPRGKVATRTVSLFFKDDKLARMVGVNNSTTGVAPEAPDKETLIRERTEEQSAPGPKGPGSGGPGGPGMGGMGGLGG